MKKTLASLFLALVSTGALATTPVIVNPDNLHWQPIKELPGAEVAVISGDPSKKGLYVARVKFPANYQMAVHTHKVPEYDTVLSGTLYVGMGSTVDTEHGQKIVTGGFVTIPPNVPHYSWTKEETILQINGMGPWGTFYTNNNNKHQG